MHLYYAIKNSCGRLSKSLWEKWLCSIVFEMQEAICILKCSLGSYLKKGPLGSPRKATAPVKVAQNSQFYKVII